MSSRSHEPISMPVEHGGSRSTATMPHNVQMRRHQLVPYQAEDDEQFWCLELGGTYTLRTMNDIQKNCQPGMWQMGSAGYPYFIKKKKEEKKS